MSERAAVKTQATNARSLTASGVLQRKCASCGNHTTAGGKCEECENKGRLLQRKSNGHSEPPEVPPIVHEVLNSPGQPLDAATRAFMEPRFNHDFSLVRTQTAPLKSAQAGLRIGAANDRSEQEADRIAEQVVQVPLPSSPNGFTPRPRYDFSQVRAHTDAKAAESARAINALAYTVGRDVVFGAEQYAPETMAGRKLLAHELTHVAHQGSRGIQELRRQRDCEMQGQDNSPEAQWANQNSGKAFGVNDSMTRRTPSDELILWNFCVGESRLRPAHEQRLREASARWNRLMVVGARETPPPRPDLRIKILGAASASGDSAANENLAIERANAVKEFLKNNNIPDRLIDVEGVGTRSPLADETSPENMARNRRVEVFLYVPTQMVGGLGPTVDADVRNLTIGPGATANPAPTFDVPRNLFSQKSSGMQASAQVTLTALLGGASIGIIQILIADSRWATYRSTSDGSNLILDYDRCISGPCRDVEEATSRFSFDSRSLTVSSLRDVSGTVSIVDFPSVGFPLRYPDPRSGGFVLTRYNWGMSFLIILGVRDGGLFMPLHHAFWSVIADEGIDVSQRKTTGPGPESIHGTWEPGGLIGFPLETVMSGKTCRLEARSIEVAPEELPCRPSERRV